MCVTAQDMILSEGYRVCVRITRRSESGSKIRRDKCGSMLCNAYDNDSFHDNSRVGRVSVQYV